MCVNDALEDIHFSLPEPRAVEITRLLFVRLLTSKILSTFDEKPPT